MRGGELREGTALRLLMKEESAQRRWGSAETRSHERIKELDPATSGLGTCAHCGKRMPTYLLEPKHLL
jgi:hypothetical protein